MNLFFISLLVGVLTTLTSDLIFLASYLYSGSIVDWSMLGRITGYLIFKGKFIALNWQNYTPLNHENLIGWICHYGVGISYSIFYIFVINHSLKTENKLWKAVVFLWILMIIPLFILDPIAGDGFLGIKTPNPFHVIISTIIFHSFFGTSLWFWTKQCQKLIKKT